MERYLSRLSGPLLDRIDLQVEVARVPYRDLTRRDPMEICSGALREKVLAARGIEAERFKGTPIRTNSQMGVPEVNRHCPVEPEGARLLEAAFDRLGLSARAYHRVLKVSRTIADLEGSERIRTAHIAEAIQYRVLDRYGRNAPHGGRNRFH